MNEIEKVREIKTTVERNTDNAEIPDAGFARTAAIRESDIDSDEIADKNEIKELPVYIPFIDYEAIESDSYLTKQKFIFYSI